MKYLFSLLLVLLFSCAAPPPEGKGKTVTMKITHINPPKHVYVDLTNVETGETWERVYVGKHCNNWRSIPMNATLTMTEYSYSQGGRKYREINGRDVYSKYCR